MQTNIKKKRKEKKKERGTTNGKKIKQKTKTLPSVHASGMRARSNYRLVNKVLASFASYDSAEKLENGLVKKSSGVEMITKLKRTHGRSPKILKL